MQHCLVFQFTERRSTNVCDSQWDSNVNNIQNKWLEIILKSNTGVLSVFGISKEPFEFNQTVQN